MALCLLTVGGYSVTSFSCRHDALNPHTVSENKPAQAPVTHQANHSSPEVALLEYFVEVTSHHHTVSTGTLNVPQLPTMTSQDRVVLEWLRSPSPGIFRGVSEHLERVGSSADWRVSAKVTGSGGDY